jgi:hypothetical protein
MGAASEWRRVLKSEDATANAANRYMGRTAESYSRDFTLAERQFRVLREGVTVERAIEERRVRLRPYAFLRDYYEERRRPPIMDTATRPRTFAITP